jgi:hypothetical protein
MGSPPRPARVLRLDGVNAFINDDVIMLKALAAFGDPVELTEDDARALGAWLIAWADAIDPPPIGRTERAL